jgi:hypothetical protein
VVKSGSKDVQKAAPKRGLSGEKYYNEGRGYQRGGKVSRGTAAPTTLAGSTYRNVGKGYAAGGSVKGGAGSGLGRLRNTRIAAKVPDKTEA